jgi:very-short-patch-repair endonuclease
MSHPISMRDALPTYVELMTGRLEAQIDYKPVLPATDWRDKLDQIRRNYEEHQRAVDLGLNSWLRGDPYEIADWALLFTPIEAAMWSEIRCSRLPTFWPQLPVGRFYVDFGNPALKVAIECDGKQFHDPIKDAARDVEMSKMGWTVFRIDGAGCLKLRDYSEERDDAVEARLRGDYRQAGYEYADELIEDVVQYIKYHPAIAA